MKTYAYIRVSTTKQDTENQKFKILEYAQSSKIVIDEFMEIEISSRKSSKDRLIDELIDKLNPNDLIIATELSRLGRNMLDLLNTINLILSKGAKIYFVNQPELSTTGQKALDDLKYAIYGYVAQTERDFISTRTKQALSNLKSKGVKLGHGKAFLKSMYDKHEEEIYDFISRGISFETVCKLFNKHGKNGFRNQSLRNWFNSRYEKDKMLGTYQRTEKYSKHLKSIQ